MSPQTAVAAAAAAAAVSPVAVVKSSKSSTSAEGGAGGEKQKAPSDDAKIMIEMSPKDATKRNKDAPKGKGAEAITSTKKKLQAASSKDGLPKKKPHNPNNKI